ncbi:MAG: hypothetical protein IPM54_17870 [Polyangiaceae bacterium]|nr:hypothetical protein [Polyangiaceae bacterium]
MTSRIEDALDSVENLRGWRAFLALSPEAADADAIVGAQPNDILSDPEYMVATRWSTALPQRMGR